MTSQEIADLDLVRLCVAAFATEAHTNTNHVVDALVAAGVSIESADELVGFVPLAFGRLAMSYDRVVGPAHFVACDETKQRRLRLRVEDERFYRAAWMVARESSNARFDTVLEWSTEPSSAREIQSSGVDAENVKLDEPFIFLPHRVPTRLERVRRWFFPRTPDEADPFGARTLLAAFLTGHGIHGRWKNRAFVSDRGDRWSVTVWPRKLWVGECFVQVDFELHSPQTKGVSHFIEAFAAEGNTPKDAVVAAQERFNAGSLHVLLAAVIDRHCCANQVVWKTWSSPSGAWRACLGHSVVRHDGDLVRFDATRLTKMVEELVATTPLERKVHAIRVYRTLDAPTKASEGLLDGEDWPELREAVDAWDAPSNTRALSIRNFTVLLPFEDVAADPTPPP